MIPVSIDSLLNGHVVENERIEFKKDWNPLKILHTLCAFANDIGNIGGGYIVIGVGEVAGKPTDIVGIDPGRYESLENELMKLCNMMSPRYFPAVSLEEYGGAHLLVLWAPAGESKPYRCPESIGDRKNERSESVYYIRRLSHTVRADREEEMLLIRRASKTSFDDMTNGEAPYTDIMRGLVEDFLSRSRSRMPRDIPNLEMYRSLRIVRGPDEAVRPVNIGLMMFTDRPERYFPGARIEVVHKPHPDGTDMDEKRFEGPLDDQIRKALEHVKMLCIQERVVKVPYQAEAIRFFSYPYEAVEETVVNAVYHKDYEIPDPVKITVLPDRIEVFNRPGPDSSISDERIAAFDMKCDLRLNIRLGDFLKSLKLAEGQNTGIPKVINSLTANGSGMPLYETDAARRFLRVTIPIHEGFLPDPETGTDKGAVWERSGYRDPAETRALILESLRVNGCQTSRELAASIGYSGVNNTFRRCLAELMEAGEAEYLYPDSPKDKRQRICLPSRRP